MNLVPFDIKGDRYLTLAELQHRIGISHMQIYRLMQRGEFPARVPLASRRIGWPETAITAWMQERIDARASAYNIWAIPTDRFIGAKEVRQITSLSRSQLERLQEGGLFPCSARIGEGRVVWLEREVRLWCLERAQ